MTLVGLNYLQHQEAVKKRLQDRQIAEDDRSSREEIASLDRTSRERISDKDRTSRELVSTLDRSSREGIAKADRALRSSIADKDREQNWELKRFDQEETKRHNLSQEMLAGEDLKIKKTRNLIDGAKAGTGMMKDIMSSFKDGVSVVGNLFGG